MAANIQLKRSSVSGKKPDAGNVAVAEPVVNLADKVLYTKDTNGNIIVIGSSLTVQVVDAANTATTSVAEVRTLQFDSDSGFDVVDRANGIAKVQMNSTFKTWNVYGQANLVADGLDTVNIVAGDFINISTNAAADPQQIRFSLSSSLSTSNVTEGSNLYFSNARVKTAVSSQTLDNASFTGAIFAGGELTLGAIGGDEGAQINLGKPVTNTTLAGNVAIDIYQNKLRIFEGGGDARGVYVDLTAASAGVGTNLIGGGTGTITSVAGITSGAVSNAQLVAATVTSQTLTNATFSANVTADRFISNNNGNGENYKLGDDVWIGDYNIANSLRIKGVQDSANAYINFGTGDTATLGRTGAGNLTYTAGFNADSLNATANVNGANARFTGNLHASYVISSVIGNVSSLANHTTTNLAEGTNLYYSNARVYANVSQLNYATVTYVNNEIANLVASAPATLDTLNELAAALGDDANFATTTATLIGQSYNQANAAYDTANTKVATVAGVTSTTISNAQLASGISSSGILTTANVAEVTNLYFTNARAIAAFTEGSGINIDANGLITATVTGGTSTTVSSTAPVSPSNGDIWVDSDTGQYFIYLNDGTSSQWVEFNSGTSGGSGGASGSGVGVAAITLDSFTGNGVQTQFILSVTPSSENDTFINIDGVSQLKTAYSISGTTLTFSSAPANGANIEVATISSGSTSGPTDARVVGFNLVFGL